MVGKALGAGLGWAQRGARLAIWLGVVCGVGAAPVGLRGQALAAPGAAAVVTAQAAPAAAAVARQAAPAKAGARAIALPAIDTYIHDSWTKLRRSMTECATLVDPKTKTAPVLYLPRELAEPAEVHRLRTACGVRVEHLPRRIDHPGALLPREIATPGLLYLPHPYVVPGGRFNEQYGWDSYFIMLGLLADGHGDLAKGMVENFFFEIEHYGNLLNANRTYFLTRSQPPLLSSMIRLVYEAEGGAPRAGVHAEADRWLAGAYGFAVKDHSLWLSPEHAAGDTGLARYHDLGEGPVPEMADDSTYYPDVIRWILKHENKETVQYIVDGPILPDTSIVEGVPPSAADYAKVARESCDALRSEVCLHAHVSHWWLTRSFYEGDRAMRESGFDTTFRFGAFSGSTQQYAPVGLNALLYKYEMDLAWMADHLHKPGEAKAWREQAAARKVAIDKYLWNGKSGLYFDYNFVTHRQSTYNYLTTYYPLWAGAASPAQAKAVVGNLGLFLKPGGVAMSTTDSGVQWDLPFGWAPTTYLAAAGLERAGAQAQARTVAERFEKSVQTGYAEDGTIREKYNVVQGDADVRVSAGYKQNVIGFGWTNGVYRKFQQFLASPAPDAAAALGVPR